MELENNWKKQSLENLERKDLGSPKDGDSYLLTRVLQLRKTPVEQFTIEDIRAMIGQNEGLLYLITLAKDVFMHDLFAEGDFILVTFYKMSLM